MSYESTAEPIKIGYLMDFTLPDRLPAGDDASTSPIPSTSSSTRRWSRG